MPLYGTPSLVSTRPLNTFLSQRVNKIDRGREIRYIDTLLTEKVKRQTDIDWFEKERGGEELKPTVYQIIITD